MPIIDHMGWNEMASKVEEDKRFVLQRDIPTDTLDLIDNHENGCLYNGLRDADQAIKLCNLLNELWENT